MRIDITKPTTVVTEMDMEQTFHIRNHAIGNLANKLFSLFGDVKNGVCTIDIGSKRYTLVLRTINELSLLNVSDTPIGIQNNMPIYHRSVLFTIDRSRVFNRVKMFPVDVQYNSMALSSDAYFKQLIDNLGPYLLNSDTKIDVQLNAL